MKLTTAEWTNVQAVLEENKPVDAFFLIGYIEKRTFGKVWSQDVAIGLHKHDEAMVNEALEILAKEREEARG